MKKSSTSLAVAAVGLVLVGLVVGLLIGRFAMKSSAQQPNTDAVTNAVTRYVTAFNTGDVDTLGSLTCGSLKASFDKAGADRVRSEALESTRVRGRGTVTHTQNASIDGDMATVIATVKYENANPGASNAATSVFGLEKAENHGWQLCWSFPIANAN